jgi:DNA-binding transcriptional MerR regulator
MGSVSRAKRIYTPARKQEVLEAIRRRMTLIQASKKFGIPDGTIRNWCEIAKIKPALSITRLSPEQIALINEGIREGLPVREIKELVPNVSESAIFYYITKAKSGEVKGRCLTTGEPAPEPAPEPPLRTEIDNLKARVAKLEANGKRMTLEEFVYMLKAFATDWELAKNKLHQLEKNVEKWQSAAANLNAQLNRGGK